MGIVDPVLQENFWPITAGVLMSVFAALPGAILLGQVVMAVLAPIVYFGLGFINIPVTASMASYWGVLYVLLGDTISELMAS